jgi:hypothetical protein
MDWYIVIKVLIEFDCIPESSENSEFGKRNANATAT